MKCDMTVANVLKLLPLDKKNSADIIYCNL